jgi:carboxypeptidase C (cathepsin A)
MLLPLLHPAGHMVPQTRPVEALDMFSRFINRQPLQPEGK